VNGGLKIITNCRSIPQQHLEELVQGERPSPSNITQQHPSASQPELVHIKRVKGCKLIFFERISLRKGYVMNFLQLTHLLLTWPIKRWPDFALETSLALCRGADTSAHCNTEKVTALRKEGCEDRPCEYGWRPHSESSPCLPLLQS